VERARLRPDRDRLELLGIAMAAVDERTQRVDGVDPALVDEADLGLVDRLARVEGDRRRVDATRIGSNWARVRPSGSCAFGKAMLLTTNVTRLASSCQVSLALPMLRSAALCSR
jgi:hypothetical protein